MQRGAALVGRSALRHAERDAAPRQDDAACARPRACRAERSRSRAPLCGTHARRGGPRGSRPRSRAAGFTFIELMVVITVVGLMSALVVANLDGLTDRSSLQATSRALGNQILTLRDQAALQGRELLLEIDVDKQRWRVVDVPSPTDVPDPDDRREMTFEGTWQTPREGVILESLEFARSDVDRKGLVTIAFDADGQLSPSGFVVFFRHENLPEEDGVSVEVTGLTGAVDFLKGRHRSEEVREPDDF